MKKRIDKKQQSEKIEKEAVFIDFKRGTGMSFYNKRVIVKDMLDKDLKEKNKIYYHLGY